MTIKQILLQSLAVVVSTTLLSHDADAIDKPLTSTSSKPLDNVIASPAMAKVNHPVTTSNSEAQQAFNDGLTYVFAYNHDLAFKKFQKAAELDPHLAMAYWGMALALGQNINTDITRDRELRAYNFIQKALALAERASEVEQAYIHALAQRYTDDPKIELSTLRAPYREAMKKLSNKYPEDLDAASLYAESILDLDPWMYWTWDGKPREGVMEAIAVLESVLIRNPYHVGANHFYIHSWEESPTPERALLSAIRLTYLLPGAGHLLHMPCHIFLPCGYYEEAIKTNKNAIEADRQYVEDYGIGGEYPLHYLTHNYTILIRTYMLAENYEEAIKACDQLKQFAGSHFEQMAGHLLKAIIAPLEVNLYFGRWKEVLDIKPFVLSDAFVQSYWHFSRAMAFINLGDLINYQNERTLLSESKAKIDPNERVANNPANQIIAMAELVLNAQLARVNKQESLYIDHLKALVDQQNRLLYDEPPAWYTSFNIELGQAFFEQKQYSDAEQAFRAGLKDLQRNGRLLQWLRESLKAQGYTWDASWVEREIVKE